MQNVRDEYGVEIPALENQVVLKPHLNWVFNFFVSVSSQRRLTEHGPQPISFVEMESLARLKGIRDEEDLDDLVHFIPRLDEVYLNIKREQIRSARKKAQEQQKASRAMKRRSR